MNLLRRNRLILLVVVLASVLFLTANALGVDNIQELNNAINQQQPEIQPTNLWFSFFKLILVLGVILLAAWSIIHMFGKKINSKMQGTWLHVVDEIMLGQNRGVVLCEINGKLYALGVTDGQINLLFEVDNPKLLEEISRGEYLYTVKKEDSLTDSFTGWINRKFKMDKSSSKPPDFHLLMQEQVKRIKGVSFPATRTRGSNAKRGGEDE